MQCLRCGKEIDEGAVFCQSCLEVMAKHPVKPHTVVNIPERSIRDRNLSARKAPRTEESTDLLERKLLQLRLWVGLLTAALVLCICLISWQEIHNSALPAIGQNYTAIETSPQGGR